MKTERPKPCEHPPDKIERGTCYDYCAACGATRHREVGKPPEAWHSCDGCRL